MSDAAMRRDRSEVISELVQTLVMLVSDRNWGREGMISVKKRKGNRKCMVFLKIYNYRLIK